MKSKMRFRSMFALLALVLGVVVGACGADTAVTEVDRGASLTPPKEPQQATSDKSQAGLRALAKKATQRDAPIAYAAVDEGSGRVRLDNPAHRMTSMADRAGIVVSANEQPASLQIRMSAYGCEGTTRRVLENVPTTMNNRVSFHRDELRMEEWYLNGPLGLEQGFTLAEAPGCAGTKRIEMQVDGDVSPSLEDADGDGGGEMVRFVEENGRARFVYRDLDVVDASGKTLPSWMTVAAGEVTIHFDDAGAVYPVEVDPVVVTLQAKLFASDGAASDRFGVAVAIDGNTAIVGAYQQDVPMSDGGAAYVYVRNGATWVQQAKLTASDAGASDYFGRSVAILGDTAIVGAYGDDIGTNADQGSAYVFTRNGTTWTQQAKLTASDGAANDAFGVAVALSSDTAIVGAFMDDDPIKGPDSGSAYVFVKPAGGIWPTTQTAKLTASNGAANHDFGTAVAISGDTALIGATGANSNKGQAYVFVQPGGGWVTSNETAKLTATNGGPDDKFGFSVALSGDTALVGAYQNNDKASYAGAAYVFFKLMNAWVDATETAKLTASDGQNNSYFGSSVATDGSTALIGSSGDTTNLPAVASGSAYVFTKPSTGWTNTSIFAAKFSPDDGQESEFFGYSVAFSGTTTIVGAYGDNVPSIESGSAYVFLSECTTAVDCVSGFCVDDVCCDSACMGTCQACSVAAHGLTNGTCGNIDIGYQDNLPANSCNGTSACNGSGMCIANKLANGAACSLDTQCATNHCVDGVCCNSACDMPCQACAGPDTLDGTCGSIKSGPDLDNACANGTCEFGICKLNNGQVCTLASQCSSGHCVDGVCCDKACAGTCQACTSILTGQGITGECNSILTNTDPDKECPIGTSCREGNCRLGNGQTCTLASQCVSDFCVDGVCCDTACDSLCRACSVAIKKNLGKDGVCEFISQGKDPATRDADTCKPSISTTCGQNGKCAFGNCQLWNPGTTCGTGGTCTGNTFVGFGCNGFGNCVPDAAGMDCAPGLCLNNQCNPTCSTNADCAFGAFCDPIALECKTKAKPGIACGTNDTACQSGFCVDGVCCDSPCGGTCKACSKAAGSSENGYCENVAEDMACKLDPDNPCGFTGACTAFGACEIEAYGKNCGNSKCKGFLNYESQICNGFGACVPDPNTLTECFPFLCGVQDGGMESTCKETCQEMDGDAGPSDCVQGFHCLKSQCVPDTKTCASINDCTGTDVCDPVTKQCVPRPESTPITDPCACRLPGKTHGSSGLPAVALALMALGLRRRLRFASLRP